MTESDERFRSCFAHAAIGFGLTTPEGVFVDANPTYCTITGYSVEELRHLPFHKLVHPDDQAENIRQVGEMLEGRSSGFVIENRYIHKSGEIVWVRKSVTIDRRPDGSPRWLIALVEDVTQRRQAREELKAAKLAAEQAKAQADAANRAKDRFLATLSHELRTPLTPVRLLISEWEENKAALPAQFHEDLATIRRNVDLECRLIDDLLDVNRIASGKVSLQLAPLAMNAEVRHAATMIEADAYARRISVAIENEALTDTVIGDAARVQQILWNLFKNAIKFTPNGGSIFVRIYNATFGDVCVEMRDTGAGIEPSAIDRIFRAFEQGSDQITRRFGGLGLGLTISKALAELHGGTLTASSPGIGKGATFLLRLAPAKAPLAVEHKAAPAQLTVTDSMDAAAPSGAILLVEDHRDSGHMLQRLLSSLGYNVELARSCAEAQTLAESREFDIIVSDLGLPDGHGNELIERLSSTRPVKAIALSGYGMEEDIARSSEAGFMMHLVKPVSLEQLDQAIRKALRSGEAK